VVKQKWVAFCEVHRRSTGDRSQVRAEHLPLGKMAVADDVARMIVTKSVLRWFKNANILVLKRTMIDALEFKLYQL
jgi:hypothetical protein